MWMFKRAILRSKCPMIYEFTVLEGSNCTMLDSMLMSGARCVKS
jgi:hypothetical protein